MPKLFITGIGGFIGRNIAEEAVKQGYDVSGSDTKSRKIHGAHIVKADIRDKSRMVSLTKGFDYMIHLAAVTSNVEFDKRLSYCYDVNVNGFNSVIEAAYANRCKRFLYASSSAIYKDSFSEETVIDIRNMTNHYAKTKLINEAIANSYRMRGLLDTVGLRFFNVYGTGESEKGSYASIINIFMKCDKAGKPISIYGNGKQARDLVYVTDAAKIVLKLIKKAKKDVYNVGTGKATSYNDIAGMMSVGKKVHVKNTLSSYQNLTMADTSRLLHDIGSYSFVDVKTGIKKLKSV